MGDGLVVGQKVVRSQILLKAGRPHQLSDRIMNPHQEQVAAPFPIGIGHRLQGVDAAKVAEVDAVHAQQQEALPGILGQVAEDGRFDVAHCPKVEVTVKIENL